jgi:lipopolysaccharide export system protein LptA
MSLTGFTDSNIEAPAQAGTHRSASSRADKWIPACAGIIRWLGLPFLLLVMASPAGAQIVGPAGASDQPLSIQADSGVEWQQDQHLYIARGNAVATRGTSEVHADTLIAHYREAKGTSSNTGGNTEIYRVEAEGHVTMKRDAQTVVGDRAVYDVDQQIAVVTGKGLKMTTATDVVTARDSLEWYDQKQVAVARGDAVALRTGKTVKGDILTAYMVKSAPAGGKPGNQPARPQAARGKPGAAPAAAKAATTPAAATAGAPATESKISRVDAQGHVVVSNAVDTGKGDFGVYNAETGIATLIGNVSIQRGKDVIRGQRGVMDLNNNVSRMLPGGAPGAKPQRVQGLFVREEAHPGGKSQTGKSAAGKPAGDKPAAEKKP